MPARPAPLLRTLSRKEMSTMTGTFKKVECDPPCGFMVKSHDEKEVIDLVKQHVKKIHNKDIAEKDIRSKIRSE